MKKRRQTIFESTIILLVAMIVVKIIGAAFKIPLYWVIDRKGMGYFNLTYPVYGLMLTIATAGFPTVVSKMVAEAMAHGKNKESKKILKVALVALSIIGALGTIVLYVFAKPLAALMGNESASITGITIMAISPAIFCVAIMAAFRGYFQGQQNMYPPALSEVIEALGKLIIGLMLASHFLNIGYEYGAAGALLGVSIGAFIGAVFLVGIYVFGSKVQTGVRETSRSSKNILKELLWTVFPVTLGAAAVSITGLCDSFTVVRRLPVIPGVDNMELFGIYGQATTMFSFPPQLLVALAVSIVPAVARSLKLGDKFTAKSTVENVMRVTVLFALPCAVGLSLLSAPILMLLFGDTAAAFLLQVLGAAALFISVNNVCNAILQAYGKPFVSARNILIGGAVKATLNWIMIPKLGINAAAYSTNICYFIIVALNLIAIARITGARFNLKDFIIKPVLAVGGMAAGVLLAYNGLIGAVGTKIAGVAAIAVGGVFYLVLVFVTKCIRKEDIILLRTKKS